MRSLALLLLLLNLGFLFWQLKWLPSPSQFAQTLWPSNSQESNLQRPVLLDEPQKPFVLDKSDHVDNVNSVQESNLDTVTHTPIESGALTPNSQTDVKISQSIVTNIADQVEKQPIALNENSKMTVDLTEANTTGENQTKERPFENATVQQSEKNQVVVQIAENANTRLSNQTVNTVAPEINARVFEKMPSKLQDEAGLHKTEAQTSVQEQSEPAPSQQSTKPHKSIKEPSKQIVKKPSKPVACFRSGPYTQASVAQKKENWLKNQNNVSVDVQSRKTQVLESTWVYLPPFESRQAALRTQQRLFKVGINDCYVLKKGRFNNAISLGLYRQNANVKPRLKELSAKGYKNVKTQKRYKSHTKYWLNVKMFADSSEWLNQHKKFKGLRLTTVACESLQPAK
ncbi:MAG: hypothetical protein DRR16_12340 [Candidatus Parabeggiatoa sp. nov. 3]|nr:MAG: hypothetical protein DRR00_08540 [Gammaproteobacteria bacterium]RKZ66889.1 MAG: hypothetical protein DRQ99_08355 [Gammaproteobacteria bacterium]RKZ85288.1 MAG: hypothetical protein DRR16_12340 [Gammaproteobacteria bacterium]